MSRFPFGWFAVCPTRALRPGKVHGFVAFERDWVAYRTEGGQLRVTEGRCPHLGGALAQVGRVRGEALECGLHRRSFDADGQARRHDGQHCEGVLQQLPIAERAGMLFFWFHPTGQAPQFELPEVEEGPHRWSPWQYRSLLVPTRPALIMQDLADVDHFVSVHDYRRPEPIEPLQYSEYGMNTHMGFFWDTGLPGKLRFIRAEFQSEVSGLGFQYTETLSLRRRYGTRHLVLPTPIGPSLCRVWLGVSSHIRPLLGAGMTGIALKPAAHLLASQAFWRDIDRDAVLWRHQEQTIDPLLTVDPSVRHYRSWAQRFFEAPEC